MSAQREVAETPPDLALMLRLENLLAGQGKAADGVFATQFMQALILLLDRGELSAVRAVAMMRPCLPVLPELALDKNGGAAAYPARLGDRFVAVARLGAGGQGVTVKALDLVRLEAGESDVYVALKLARKNAATDMQRLFLEWRHAQSVSHRNIVGIYDVARAGPLVFCVQEYVPGLSLSALKRRSQETPLSRAQIMQTVTQIAVALARFHACHRIHGDLKPANIMCRDDGLIKLIDFSSVLVIPHLELGRWVGEPDTPRVELTPAYASPERLAGEDPDPSDDIFSFAVTICEMLDAHPFGGLALTDRKAIPAPRLPSGLSRHGQRAITKALAPRRKDRWATIDAFVEALHLPK